MKKYKVGGRVRIVSKWPEDGSARQNREGLMDKWLGRVMTIREATTVGVYRMVEDRHDRGPHFLGWVWNDACIAGFAYSQKIIITTDGKTTTAKLFNGKDLVKSAEAKCSPSDEFDFEKGAALAVDRLLGHEEKPANPFEAGDFVRVIGCTHYRHGLALGSVGRVSGTRGSDICEVDGFGPNGERWSQSVHPCDLIKIYK